MKEKIKRVFILSIDERYGDDYLGLKLKGSSEHCDPLKGLGVLHDMLEHPVTSRIGDPSEEFQALGAMAYLRGSTGWFDESAPLSTIKAASQIGGEFEEILLHVVDTENLQPIVPRNSRPLAEERSEEWIEDVLRHGARSLYSTDSSLVRQAYTKNKENIRSHLRAGWRWAERQYPYGLAFELAHSVMTPAIAKIDKYLKNASPYRVGEKVIISINVLRSSYMIEVQPIERGEERYEYD